MSANSTPPIALLEGCDIYQGPDLVLKDISLSIQAGDFVYLVGKTGSGKSSLLKTLYGALPLRQGRGQVAGIALQKLTWKNLPQLRRQLGIIFQDFGLLHDRSVLDNLRFVLRATDWADEAIIEQRCLQLLEQVGLRGKANSLPHALSGGEQQRVAIARALLNEPPLIIADEPTGNLDPDTADDILVLLRQVAQRHQAAVLLATHDYRMIEKFPGTAVWRCQNRRILKQDNFVV